MLTVKKTFSSQVTDTKPKHRQLIQFGDDILRERQQARQAVQLRIQAVPVSLGWVGLDSFSWGWLYTVAEKQTQHKCQFLSKMKANICQANVTYCFKQPKCFPKLLCFLLKKNPP